jgi:Xaa-Pro aminopeptidase
MRHVPINPALFLTHRQQLTALLPPQSLVIMHAADLLPTSGDGTLKIHPASDLFWLSGIEQEESVLDTERKQKMLKEKMSIAHFQL